MSCCFGVARSSARRTLRSLRTGCGTFGSAIGSAGFARFISMRSTLGLGVWTILMFASFLRSGSCASRRFHIPSTSPACSCATATSREGTLRNTILSRSGLPALR